MFYGPKIDHSSRVVCTQPGCLLHRAELTTEQVAEILIQVLSRNSTESLIDESERIFVRPRCKHCALRVMQGRKAYLTEAEWSHLDDLGHWHYRRQKRRKYFGYQPH